MSIAIWPADLPQTPLRDSLSENIPNNLIRSESESGVVKVRRKGASVPITFDVGYYLTSAQRDILKEFVAETLIDGSLRFEYPHPYNGETVEMRIVPGSDELYSLSASGTGWAATLKLEILP